MPYPEQQADENDAEERLIKLQFEHRRITNELDKIPEHAKNRAQINRRRELLVEDEQIGKQIFNLKQSIRQ